MREILFRGVNDSGEWVEGNLIKSDDGYYINEECSTLEELAPEYHHQGMGCGIEDRSITDRYEACEHGWECGVESTLELQPIFTKINTETIGQYTGLLDKNGKKIFEGDIDSDGFTFTYNTKMGGWYRMKNGEGFQWHEQCVNKGRLPFEITSNIHE